MRGQSPKPDRNLVAAADDDVVDLADLCCRCYCCFADGAGFAVGCVHVSLFRQLCSGQFCNKIMDIIHQYVQH